MVKEIVRDIIGNNVCFAKGSRAKAYGELKEGQSPNTTLIMCADSRVPTCVVSQDTINKVFCIENIGNQVKTAEGSVDYGVMHLKTPLLLILGHTNCGAVEACFADYSKETEGIQEELDFLSDGLAEVGASYSQEEPNWLDKYAEKNVDYQVGYARDKYIELVNNGELTIMGMMMDFTGAYADERCAVYMTNVNGDTEAQSIKESVALKGLDAGITDKKVKRIS